MTNGTPGATCDEQHVTSSVPMKPGLAGIRRHRHPRFGNRRTSFRGDLPPEDAAVAPIRLPPFCGIATRARLSPGVASINASNGSMPNRAGDYQRRIARDTGAHTRQCHPGTGLLQHADRRESQHDQPAGRSRQLLPQFDAEDFAKHGRATARSPARDCRHSRDRPVR